MSFQIFQKNVNFIVGSNTYDIPITDMSVVSGPYSREVNDGTAIRAFDGRFYQVHQGWRTRCTFNWSEMTEQSNQDLYTMLVDLVATGVCTVVFNPDGANTSVDMVLEDPSNALKATFRGNSRKRAASLSMISTDISERAPTFITADTEPDPIFWIDGNDIFWTTSGDLSVHTNTGLDLSLLSINDLEYHSGRDKIIGLGAGKYYEWNPDGSGFVQLFSSGYGDITGFSINQFADKVSGTAHELGVFNHRWKQFDLSTGLQTDDTEFRIGSSTLSLTRQQYHHGKNRYYYASDESIYYVEPSAPYNQVRLGLLGHLTSQDICIWEGNSQLFHLANGNIYSQNDDFEWCFFGTCTPGEGESFVSFASVGADRFDLYEHAGVMRLIGNGANPFRVNTNGQGHISDWQPALSGILTICTRRPLL